MTLLKDRRVDRQQRCGLEKVTRSWEPSTPESGVTGPLFRSEEARIKKGAL